MLILAAILALLTGVAGWFYMFYSQAAARLGAVEDERLNRRRVRLRRVGGGVMLALGVLLYLGFYAVDARFRPAPFVAIWVGVLVLLAALMLLALVDVRLTLQLRNRRRQRRRDEGLSPDDDRA